MVKQDFSGHFEMDEVGWFITLRHKTIVFTGDKTHLNQHKGGSSGVESVDSLGGFDEKMWDCHVQEM